MFMHDRKILSSTGDIVNLDDDQDVREISAEHFSMKPRTFGGCFADSQFFSFCFRGFDYHVKSGCGQFFDYSSGRRILQMELDRMAGMPFECDLRQSDRNGDLSYLIALRSHGRRHNVILIYDSMHPQFEMKARLIGSKIDQDRAGRHSYSDTRPCFIHAWTRDMSAPKCLFQLACWFDAYYNGDLTDDDYSVANSGMYDSDGYGRFFS